MKPFAKQKAVFPTIAAGVNSLILVGVSVSPTAIAGSRRTAIAGDTAILCGK